MLCAKYDYDLDIQVKQEEAFEEGLEKGIAQNCIETAKRMLAKNCDVDFIKEITNLSAEEIQNINRR